MYPYLRPGQVVVIRRSIKVLKKDDIIMFIHDEREKIKRIKSIDGDSVIVIGDNPQQSTDSRMFGAISKKDILGKLLIRI